MGPYQKPKQSYLNTYIYEKKKETVFYGLWDQSSELSSHNQNKIAN